MTGLEFFAYVLWSILWPPKGIIYMEEQAIQWIVALSHAWINANGAMIITIIAIYMIVMFVVFSRTPHMRIRGGIIGQILHFIWTMFVVIIGAWGFLIYGALRGEINGNRGENNANVNYQYQNSVTRALGITYRFTRLSLHFRLGRAIYRFFDWLLARIPVIARNDRVREVLSRVLAMIVILWGVWNIPYNITH